MIKFLFILYHLTFSEGMVQKFQSSVNTTSKRNMIISTERPEWQLFDNKALSIVLLISIPLVAVLLLIVFCVLIYCCCKSRNQEQLEVTAEDLINMKLTPEELKAADITPKKLHETGATYKQLAQLGATPSQLVECGATKSDLEKLGATHSVISHVGFSEKKNEHKYKDDYSASDTASKKESSHKDMITKFRNMITNKESKPNKHPIKSMRKSKKRNTKYMEEENEDESSENIGTQSPDDDTKTTVTTTTALRPVKSDSFSTAMLAHGSEISEVPVTQPKQKYENNNDKPWRNMDRFNY